MLVVEAGQGSRIIYYIYFILVILFFHQSVVDLQCCADLCYIAE